MDLDASLSLEDDYYKQGYEEGSRIGRVQGLIEGRIYGAEKAFERFLQIGIIRGRLDTWQSIFEGNDRIQSSIEKIRALLTTVPAHNDECADGMDYDSIMHQLENKMKALAMLSGDDSLRHDFLKKTSRENFDDREFVRPSKSNRIVCG